MNRHSGSKWWNRLILGLLAIGLISQLFLSPGSILIPAAVVALVWYLYKFPPRWLLRIGSPGHPAFQTRRDHGNRQKKKKHPFRVIDGKKKGTL
ncbi:hypothetical protein [Staphylospora marina]|uniref:hypothetical protein n=1 Tax=Staphylospora marina TaxID=2490858 RepID=UPI000F5BFBEA|nr:hypothetical protein [Staphylospora marina]